jgi:glycosyltransferase involved in cell wall biosynthesis
VNGRPPGGASNGRHVLIVVENMSFTYDTRVKHIAETLVDAGYRLDVVSPRFRGDPRFHVSSRGIGVRTYWQPHLPGLGGHLLEYFVSLVAIVMHVLRERAAGRAEIIHVCNPPDLIGVLGPVFRALGAQVIYDQHDLNPELLEARYPGAPRFLRRVVLSCERIAARSADQTIVANESSRRRLLERSGVRAIVVRNGPTLDEIAAVPAITARGSPLVVGYLGNINPQDGVDLLIDAAYELVVEQGRADLRFLVVGDGSSRRQIEERAKELGLGDVVEFAGMLAPQSALARIAGCDMCVQPDRRSPFTEATTMVKTIEYLALGRPVISFDLRETRFSCGDAAHYASGDDHYSFACAIRDLADDPGRRARLAALALRRFHSYLHWGRSIPALLAAYDGLSLAVDSRSRRDLQRRAVEVRGNGNAAETHQGRSQVDETLLSTLQSAPYARARQDQNSLAVVRGRAGSPDATQEPVGVPATPPTNDVEPR